MPGVNRQGQAHIVSTAVCSTALRLRVCSRSFVAGRADGTDPQPASINPTINISIVFICSFLRFNHNAPAIRDLANRDRSKSQWSQRYCCRNVPNVVWKSSLISQKPV